MCKLLSLFLVLGAMVLAFNMALKDERPERMGPFQEVILPDGVLKRIPISLE